MIGIDEIELIRSGRLKTDENGNVRRWMRPTFWSWMLNDSTMELELTESYDVRGEQYEAEV